MPLRIFKIDTAEKELRKHLTQRFNDVQLGRVTHRPAVQDKRGGKPEAFEADFTGVDKKKGEKVKGHLVHEPSIGVLSMTYGPLLPPKPAGNPSPAPVLPAPKKPGKISFNFKL